MSLQEDVNIPTFKLIFKKIVVKWFDTYVYISTYLYKNNLKLFYPKLLFFS